LLAVSPFSSFSHFVALSHVPIIVFTLLSHIMMNLVLTFCESHIYLLFIFLLEVFHAVCSRSKHDRKISALVATTQNQYIEEISVHYFVSLSLSLSLIFCKLGLSSFSSLIFVVNNYLRQKFARSSQALGFRHLNKLPIRIRLLFLVRSGVIFPLRLPTLLYRIQVRPRPSALIFLSACYFFCSPLDAVYLNGQ
jgi:hypothetical protein